MSNPETDFPSLDKVLEETYGDRAIPGATVPNIQELRDWLEQNPEGSLSDFYAAMGQPQLIVSDSSPFEGLMAVIKADDDIAAGWHDNIAVAFTDRGGDRVTANLAAQLFMLRTFEVPTGQHLADWDDILQDATDYLEASEPGPQTLEEAAMSTTEALFGFVEGEPIPAKLEEAGMSTTEALFGFISWLTTRTKPVTFSSTHDSAIAAQLLKDYLKANNLPLACRDDWQDFLTFPQEG